MFQFARMGLSKPDRRPTAAALLLGQETAGLAMDFRVAGGSVLVRDPVTPANRYSGPLGTFLTNGSPSVKWVRNGVGAIVSVPAGRAAMDYDPVLGWALLGEATATNSLLRSQEFDNAAWVKTTGGTGSLPVVTANAVAAPDGTMTADQIVAAQGAGNTSSDISSVSQSVAYANGTVVTSSVWLRSDVPFLLPFRNIENNGTYTLFSVTTQWQRFSITGTVGVSGSYNCVIGQRGAVGGTGGTVTFFMWGVQVETGTIATSYIPTVGATVARSNDTVKKLLNVLPALGAEYSLMMDYRILVDAGANKGVASINVDANNRADMRTGTATQLQQLVSNGGATQVNHMGVALAPPNWNRAAMRIKANDFALSINGAAVVADAAGSIPTGPTQLWLGNIDAGGSPSHIRIRRVVLVPRAWSNAELQARAA